MFTVKKLKLKYQLAILVIVAVFILIIAEYVFYYRFSLLTQERAGTYSVKIANQLEEKANSIALDIKQAVHVISYSKIYQKYILSEDSGDLYRLSSAISDLLETIKATNKSIAYIMLVDQRGHMLNTNTELVDSNIPADISKIADNIDFYLNLQEWPYLLTFKSVHPAQNNDLEKGNYFLYLDRVLSTSISGEAGKSYAVCAVVCKMDPLQKVLKDAALTKNSKLFLLDRENKVLSSNDVSMINKKFYNINIQLGTSSYVKNSVLYNDKLSIVRYKYIDITGWKVVSIIPVSELTSDMDNIKIFGILLGLAMIIMLLALGILISRSITKPVKNIIEFLNSVGEIMSKHRLPVLYKNEVGMLAHYINEMMDNTEKINMEILKTQTALYESKLEVSRVELAMKQAELSALQTQINPHFLYNTLECIRSMGVEINNAEIERIAMSLSKIFRYSIKGKDLVLIRDEIDCINNYLEIMSIRYMNKFVVNISISAELMHKTIIKMLLQPVVENAIYHGLERKNGPGRLTIEGNIGSDSCIWFKICDNGKGINESDLKNLIHSLSYEADTDTTERNNEKRSVGLININRRIKLIYGKQYGLSIESRENEGTSVFICIPAS